MQRGRGGNCIIELETRDTHTRRRYTTALIPPPPLSLSIPCAAAATAATDEIFSVNKNKRVVVERIWQGDIEDCKGRGTNACVRARSLSGGVLRRKRIIINNVGGKGKGRERKLLSLLLSLLLVIKTDLLCARSL